MPEKVRSLVGERVQRLISGIRLFDLRFAAFFILLGTGVIALLFRSDFHMFPGVDARISKRPDEFSQGRREAVVGN